MSCENLEAAFPTSVLLLSVLPESVEDRETVVPY